MRSNQPGGNAGGQVFDDPPANIVSIHFDYRIDELRSYLSSVANQLTKHNRMLSTFGEELRTLRTAYTMFKDDTNEILAKQQRQSDAHETQLRVLQQQVGVTVSNAQFNSTMASQKEQLRNLEVQVAKMEGPTGKKSQEMFERVIEEWVHKYHKDVLAKEAEVRHVRTQEFCRLHVEKELKSSVDGLESKIVPLQKSAQLAATQEQLRIMGERTRDNLKYQNDKMEERLKHTVEDIDSVAKKMQAEVEACEAKVYEITQRVAPLYDLSMLPQHEARNVEKAVEKTLHSAKDSMGEHQSEPASPATTVGSGVTPPAAALPSKASTKNSPSQESQPLPNSLLGGVDITEITGSDPRAMQILQSPTFVAFRHQILEDVRKRVGTAKESHTGEIEAQLAEVRNEVKQRVLPSRVVELIKMHQDTETPARVTEIVHRIEAIELEKISGSQFVEGLRAKGDVHVVQQKADRTHVDEVAGELRTKVGSIDATLAELIAERSEFKDVLKEVLYMHKRQQALGGPQQQQQPFLLGYPQDGSVPTTNTNRYGNTGGSPTSTLPNINNPRGGGAASSATQPGALSRASVPTPPAGLDPRSIPGAVQSQNGIRNSVDAAAEGAAGSRSNSRNSQHANTSRARPSVPRKGTGTGGTPKHSGSTPSTPQEELTNMIVGASSSTGSNRPTPTQMTSSQRACAEIVDPGTAQRGSPTAPTSSSSNKNSSSGLGLSSLPLGEADKRTKLAAKTKESVNQQYHEDA